MLQAAVTICASCSPVSNLQDAAVLEAAIYLNIMVRSVCDSSMTDVPCFCQVTCADYCLKSIHLHISQ